MYRTLFIYLAVSLASINPYDLYIYTHEMDAVKYSMKPSHLEEVYALSRNIIITKLLE